MSSRSKPSFSDVSAPQPISPPAPCSECALPSQVTCPACDASLCLAHLYLCDDCDTPLCASCIAAHRADGHSSDSDTAAELHTSRSGASRPLRIDNPKPAQALNHPPATDVAISPRGPSPVHGARIPGDASPHDSPKPSPSQSPQSADRSEAQPAHLPLLPTDSHQTNASSSCALSACSAHSKASVLLQRLLSHIHTQAESRHLALPPLHACVYIQIFCVRCGYMWQALTELPPAQTTSCPGCARQRPFAALAIGFTSRALPFHERFFLTGHALHQHPWERLRSPNSQRRHRRRPPARSLDAETREYLHHHLDQFRQIASSMLRST